jgi:hypothetical protein
MRSRLFRLSIRIGLMLALPVLASAQEATLSGSVADSTGGALPGVTVRAVHEASGNSFEAVTDERGDYRIPARVGPYRITAELAGFAPAMRTVTLLVGQVAVVNLQMALSGLQESVTVTGEAPLLDVTQSSLSGNVDPRQLQDLPVQGRNWLDLVMLAPGSKVNAVPETGQTSTVGSVGSRVGGDFSINIDGQQVTMHMGSGASEPRFSKDVIAEFEFVSSRFDATQGRSSGMQINAVTKSGTNTLTGSFSGYFRHDRFNAADHVAKRVLPYNDQQFSGTLGGPLRKDKIHFFGNYEYEREPLTIAYTTPYPHFNLDFADDHIDKKGGGRVDVQFSPRIRMAIRGSAWKNSVPESGSAQSTPSSRSLAVNSSKQLLVTLTQVLNSQLVNEFKVGYAHLLNDTPLLLKNPNNPRNGLNGPQVLLQGFTAGGDQNNPDGQTQIVYSVRDDLTYSFARGGRHTMKLGAEYLDQNVDDRRCTRCEGELQADAGPVPANIESLFPNLFDVSTWNLRPLSPISVRWRQTFGPGGFAIPRYSSAAWVQDDWTVSPKLTLNLGVRYDLELNAFANTLAIPNDGRPDFASNPWNGPDPTFESLVATRICTPALLPGCLRREALTAGAVFGPDFQMPGSHQATVGVQRQLGPTMAFDADYVYQGHRGFPRDLPLNITYNPATGANYPFSDISRRPFPEWGYVSLTVNGYRSNSHALQTALTKRMSDNWQASATYTLGVLRDANPLPLQWDGTRFAPVPFTTAPDLGGEYARAQGDQRHRVAFNGIWQLPYDFLLSGLYFFGSGERYDTRYGVDVRQIGSLRPSEHRLRPDGTMVPRNDFVGDPIHRVDLRIQRRFPLVGRAGIDGLLEIFNVLNHANYGSYVGHTGAAPGGEVARNYSAPQQTTTLAYGPRVMQLGFRFSF